MHLQGLKEGAEEQGGSGAMAPDQGEGEGVVLWSRSPQAAEPGRRSSRALGQAAEVGCPLSLLQHRQRAQKVLSPCSRGHLKCSGHATNRSTGKTSNKQK